MQKKLMQLLGRALSMRTWLRLLEAPSLPAVLVLGLAGCLAVYTASFNSENPFYFAIRQGLWFFLGAIALIGCRLIPAERLRQSVVPLAIGSLVALVAVLVAGSTHNGMRGWFRIPLLPAIETLRFAMIQPSELAKPIYVLALAALGARLPEDGLATRDFALVSVAALPWIALIALQPDFGTLLIYGLTFVVMYWLNGGRARHLAATAAVGAVAATVIYQHTPYVQVRIQGFLEPAAHADGAGWHVLQIQKALARGGLWGQSIEDALWSHNYVPLSHSDSMFATIGEVLGFAGVAVIICGIAVWIFFGLRQAELTESRFGALAISGLTLMIGIQAVTHVSVCLGLLPPTGVTMPFLSYGGSSLIATMASVGIIMSLAAKPSTPPPSNHAS